VISQKSQNPLFSDKKNNQLTAAINRSSMFVFARGKMRIHHITVRAKTKTKKRLLKPQCIEILVCRFMCSSCLYKNWSQNIKMLKIWGPSLTQLHNKILVAAILNYVCALPLLVWNIATFYDVNWSLS